MPPRAATGGAGEAGWISRGNYGLRGLIRGDLGFQVRRGRPRAADIPVWRGPRTPSRASRQTGIRTWETLAPSPSSPRHQSVERQERKERDPGQHQSAGRADVRRRSTIGRRGIRGLEAGEAGRGENRQKLMPGV